MNDVDLYAGTGQAGNAHVLTTSVVDDLVPTEGQPQDEQGKRIAIAKGLRRMSNAITNTTLFVSTSV